MKNLFLFLSGVILISSHLQAQDIEGPRSPFPKEVIAPSDNPMSEKKIELGRMLYFDKRLSVNDKISCNSCHNVMAGGDDGLSFSPGHEGKLGGRNSPTVWNSAFSSVQFWDGRAPTLEEQAKGPLVNSAEMGMSDHKAVVQKVSKISGYKKYFKEVFNDENPNIDNIAKAIAAYERTLITPNSAYDKFLAGDVSALSDSAKNGWKLVAKTGCTSCHMGPMFAGPALPAGTGFYQKFPTYTDNEYVAKYDFNKDIGRAEVTKNKADEHLFRVPTWRNVARTSPYFHNGSVSDLGEVVRVMAKTQLNKELPEQDVKDIVEFLNSLNGELPKQTEPKLPS